MHFKRITQIHCREYGVDVSLQKRDEKLEAGDTNIDNYRQYANRL